MPPAGTETGGQNAGLTGQLWAWSQASDLGQSFDSSTGYTLPNGAVRSPDASWIARDRWAALTPEQKKGFASICPDFVVELRSSSDEMPELRAKMREYIDQGVRLGWLINPAGGIVEIYRPGGPVEILRRPATLSGEDVLPGFELHLWGLLFS